MSEFFKKCCDKFKRYSRIVTAGTRVNPRRRSKNGGLLGCVPC